MLLWLAAIWAIWFVVALATSLQNYVAGFTQGNPQPWLPQFGNGLAWYSACAILTPVVIWFANRVAAERPIIRLVMLHVAGGLTFAFAHATLYSSFNAAVHYRALWAPWSADLLLLKLTTSIHVHLMIYAIIVGIVMGLRAYRTLRDREVAAARLETRLAEAETAALRAQLQPHFLFNTLNAISALVPEDPVTARRLIARLGDLLRLSIDQHRGQISPLADELEFTEAYLAIELARLGSRLRVVRRIDPEALSSQVPSLLLQPLVENAIRHGIAPRRAGGTVEIVARLQPGKLCLTVSDDGLGAGEVVEGVGLASTRQRLRHLYGTAHAFEVETSPGHGFRVDLMLPR